MPLTRAFKETVMARAKAEPEFRQALILEATDAILAGDIATGKSLLKDYLNATDSFDDVAKHLHKDEKSIRRMLGPNGNPTISNFFAILAECCQKEQLNLKVCPS